MKKKLEIIGIFVGLVIILLIFKSCCTTKLLTVEQSEKNFVVYQNSLKKVAEQYGVELVETKDKNVKYKDFLISISSDSYIEIIMLNTADSSAGSSETGAEGFTVYYRITSIDSENDFNIQLFVDLINGISGKTISFDFCDEFLKAPESKYAAQKHGFEKLNGEIIAKSHSLNFFEDWNIGYTLSKDNERELWFGGLTKYGRLY